MSKRRRGIAFVESESSRMVTFSKRRKGLFNKASELCTLCGAQVAVITFSPTGRPFVFGHDSVDQVLSRYLPADSSAEQKVVADSGSSFDTLMQWIEKSIKHCETPEDLRSLMQQFTHLLECIKGRLEDMGSSRVPTTTDSTPSMDDIFDLLEHKGENQDVEFSSFFVSLDDSSPSMDEIFEILDHERENQNPDFSSICTPLEDSNQSVDGIFEVYEAENQNPDCGMQSSSFALDTDYSTFFTGLDDLTPSIDDIFERVGRQNRQSICMIQEECSDNEGWAL